MKNEKTKKIVSLVEKELKSLADKDKALEMALYMKTKMPFYGVQKPDRVPIMRRIKKDFAPQNLEEYRDAVWQLWSLKHREEKYISLDYAAQFVHVADSSTIDMFEKIVRIGAWWDFIDPIAGHIVGSFLLTERKAVRKILDQWIKDEDFWIRRVAILSQLKHKDRTDTAMLFKYCSICMDEKEFFIRKAIGWALREYSYTDPDAVKEFLLKNKDRLSGLSFREGAKNLVKQGIMAK